MRAGAVRRLSIAAVLAAAAGFPTGAQPAGSLDLQIRRTEGVERTEDLELLLEPAAEEGETRTRDASDLGLVRVPGRFAGRVGCRSERLWCPWREVAAGDAVVVVPVFRAGRLEGVIVPTREGAPEALVVEGTVDVPGLGPVAFVQELAASEDGRFALVVPQAEIDLRFGATGWAPLYRWSFDVGGEATDLGPLRFARGSSVSGFVRDGTAELPTAGAIVTALPASAGELGEAARARLEALARPVPTDRWGFFQLGGVPPGR
jgi:hypothetical protein